MEYNPIIEDKGEQQECLYCGEKSEGDFCNSDHQEAFEND